MGREDEGYKGRLQRAQAGDNSDIITGLEGIYLPKS